MQATDTYHGLAAPRATGDVEDDATRRAIRAAMQAVYYHSIGSKFISDSAPATVLPGFEIMSLTDALRILSASRVRMREAIWTIARATPPSPIAFQARDGVGLSRYPRALLDVLTGEERRQLRQFEGKRARISREATLFSAAIVAFAADRDCWCRFDEIVAMLRANGGGSEIDAALGTALGLASNDPRALTVEQYLEHELDRATRPHDCLAELRRFEREVGMTLVNFMQQFADSIEFSACFKTDEQGLQTPIVFPAASISVQDTDTLMTHVTVTALVARSTFDDVALGIDPQSWAVCSDVFRSTRYVHGPLDLVALDPAPTPGRPGPAPRMLEEDVVFLHGRDDLEAGSCINVLRFGRLDFAREAGTIDIEYELCRSVSSRLLWDVRAGGLLVDGGYGIVRPVSEREDAGAVGFWRMTTHKTMLWSDRQPYTTSAENDFGNALNYLAPANIAWWLESEDFGHTCRTTTVAGHPA